MVGHLAHKEGQYRTTHHTHGNKGGSLLRPAAQVLDTQAEDGREHDTEEEVDEEKGNKGNPAQTLGYQ